MMRLEKLEEQLAAQLSAAQSDVNGMKEELQASEERESGLAKLVDAQKEMIRRSGDVEQNLRSELQQAKRGAEQAQENLKSYIERSKASRGCLRWGREPPIPGYTQIN